MALHPYCLLRGSEPVPSGLVGLEDAAVRAIVADETAMWVSEAPASAFGVTIERIQRHNDVMTAALDTGITPLPMRFGQRFDSEEDARRFLAEKLPELRPLFALVAGMVEMAIVVAPALKKSLRELEPLPPAVLNAAARGAGVEYLQQVRQRAAREQRARSLVEKALDRASSAVRAVTRAEERQLQPGMGVVSHLVARKDVERYRQIVLALENDGEWQFLPSAPRAPYSFCVIEETSR